MIKSLDSLPTGVPGRISGFAPLPDDIVLRLLELGFDEGVAVEKLHAAPLGGDPVAVKVGSTTVALRRALASAIHIA